MDEQKDNKEDKTKDPVNDDDKGTKSETISELDRADQIAERQKRENDRHEKLLIRGENLEARRKVGGITQAGQPAEEKKEETPKEYNDRIEKEMSEGKHNE